MDELYALACAGEDHLVLADHVAAAQNRKPNVALAAGTDIAVANV